MNSSQRQLQAFLEIVRFRSVTRAAGRLPITQSGLTVVMRDLEAQLDCRLCNRTTRSAMLTAAGLQLATMAKRILAEIDSVFDSINIISTQTRRILTLGATPMIVGSVMPLVYKAFSHLHPKLCLLPGQATFIPRRRGSETNRLGFHEILL